jgi:hypothetical protein
MVRNRVGLLTVIAVDISGDLTGIGTLLIGVATLAGVIDARRRAKRLEKGQEAIHRTVNGNATAERARSSQLVGALAKAGVEIPDLPPQGDGEQ